MFDAGTMPADRAGLTYVVRFYKLFWYFQFCGKLVSFHLPQSLLPYECRSQYARASGFAAMLGDPKWSM
jgi:hypothetical protein